MADQEQHNKLALLRSLFKGREDVFAIRWEKGAKNGYMPAYFYDPYMYRLHKIKGGTFQNYTDKSYLPLTNEQLSKHLTGTQLIGVYPLLQDNTSWFIAADFDKQNWTDECRRFIDLCNTTGIPAYLERSRSGKGGHVWIFFEQPYPAIKSRRIMLTLLTASGIISAFDKNSSFDRLFPNQNTLSGKGLGNLIALPFHKPAMEQGNSCFIDPDSLYPFPDQWSFLTGIIKVGAGKLDEVYSSITIVKPGSTLVSDMQISGKLTISLSNTIRLNRSAVPVSLINFLKEELNFANTEFIIKKKVGRNTFGTEQYFRFVEETKPRHFAERFRRQTIKVLQGGKYPV